MQTVLVAHLGKGIALENSKLGTQGKGSLEHHRVRGEMLGRVIVEWSHQLAGQVVEQIASLAKGEQG